MSNTKYSILGALVLSVSLLAGTAPAAILIQDNFDSYATQAAFVAAWPVVSTSVPSGTLSTVQASSVPQSINQATTAQRNQRAFTESGTPSAGAPIEFSFDFYDADDSLSPFRQQSNLQDSPASASGQLISMGLNNNQASAGDGGNFYMARILGYDGGTGLSAYFKLNQGSAPLRSTGWHNLKAVLTNTDIKFYVDNILSATEVTAVQATRSYDLVRIGSGLSSTAEAFVDNVLVQTIPEPTAFALFGVAAAGMAMRRRRRA
ncbi:MAG: PEP-CTERM sorting domain-containing protein [Tepidisphaeraceae bacterium]